MLLKRVCGIFLAASLLAASVISTNVMESSADDASLPNPILSYNFESTSGIADLLHGASIVSDSCKGNVLKLSGGSNGSSYMSLPSNWSSKLGSDGVTFSAWVKANSSTGAYTKIFDCSNSSLGTSYDGGNSWTSPDFGLAAGGSVYDLTLYCGTAGSGTSNCSKVKYDTHLTRDIWEYLTVTLSATDGLSVYINGSPVTYQDAQQGSKAIAKVLADFLTKTDGSGISGYTNAAIGRSLYTSDSDFAGYIDDFSIYGTTLTTAQVAKLYSSFPKLDQSPFLSIDMTASTGAIKHGASGYLYGLCDDNVPSTNVQTPIKTNICEQKPEGGLQHPGGDAIQIAKSFLESGGKFIQVACPDIYANWPYENNPTTSDSNWEDYASKLKTMVQQGKDAGLNDKLVYVPYNEPDGNWFAGMTSDTAKSDLFNQYYLKAYKVIKSVDPKALIAGPNFSAWYSAPMSSFIKFCSENNCMPDQITWHVLSDGLYSNFENNMAEYKALEKKYNFTREVVINEYGAMTDMGNPGKLVKYLGMFEDYKVNGCLAFWHGDNNMADLAADENQPNAAWWLYKWYGGMSGNTLQITQNNLSKAGLYGVASLDNNKKQVEVLFGGASGTNKIKLTHVTGTASFANTKKVKVKLEAVSYMGINGAVASPTLINEQYCDVNSDGSVTITINNMDSSSAYNLTVTPADDSVVSGIFKEGNWYQKIEAENGTRAGNASVGTSSLYTYSGTGMVQNLNNDSDSVTITATIPKTGYYNLDIIYGAATGNSTSSPSTNNPLTGKLSISVDGAASKIISLENTLNWFMSGRHTEIIQLTAGTHTFKFSGVTASAGKASLDCVYLTYASSDKPVFNRSYEAEESDFNVLGTQTTTTVTTKNSISGYSGSGYVEGLNTSVANGGGIRFTTYVDENGLYDVTIRYSSSKAGAIGLYLDNTAKTLTNKIATLNVINTNGAWKTVSKSVYLQKGINLIDLDATSADIAVDEVTLTQTANAANKTTSIEAENCVLTGTTAIASSDYASGGKYVQGILADSNAANSLSIIYNAEKAGKYKLAVYQSNSELFGSHSYNAQMIDRYITYSVNSGTPTNYFFRNTYSDESFKSQVITVTLQKGKNIIKLWNNNSVIHKNGVGGVNVCTNYTPNLDKFEITPLVIDTSTSTDTNTGTNTNTGTDTSKPAASTTSGSGTLKVNNPETGTSDIRAYAVSLFNMISEAFTATEKNKSH